MADSSSPSRASGNRSRGGNNRNRNRGNSNRNRNRGGGRGGSGGSRRFVKQKVPRRTKPPTLWEKFLGLIGLGPKRRPAPQATKKSATAGANRPANSTPKTAAGPKPKAKKKAAKKAPKRERSTRQPEIVAVSSTRLHVGNLSYDTTDSDLEKLFSSIGPVVRSEVVTHRRSDRSKGFAFVEMENLEDAKRAAESLHDKEFMGRQIAVTGAKSAGPPSDRS